MPLIALLSAGVDGRIPDEVKPQIEGLYSLHIGIDATKPYNLFQDSRERAERRAISLDLQLRGFPLVPLTLLRARGEGMDPLINRPRKHTGACFKVCSVRTILSWSTKRSVLFHITVALYCVAPCSDI